MDIHFLGTAAAEGFPALFCRCAHCRKARRLGGRNVRTRSSAIVDGVLKIDFPPDTLLHVLRDGIDLALVSDLFITHTHMDHLRAEDLAMRLPVFAHGLDGPLRVYGHDAVVRKCREAVGRPDPERLAISRISPFQTVDTGTAKVTALPANHDQDETCLLYLIEKDGKRVFYGHDTGLLPEETWERLETTSLDAAILDCTNGNLPFTGGHLNIEAVIGIRDRLAKAGALCGNSKVVATHFSHNIGLQHDDLTRILGTEHIIAAYDGMVLTI
ncbi:MBL fold metallo-hydrolase [Paenibacillus arenilitoris]|uniref:Carbon-phosphorus lyase n=1 Tax=Paenibacillus arenilitoris TaxID=2772299 RepID=A0A927CMA8_9BACL|nr:MBL fold metallo-hydrolase [Paenibacillus arenilitoris]MBD2870174.1 carbon-phosphorus lyase [Paenibacillus arenilitoris]